MGATAANALNLGLTIAGGAVGRAHFAQWVIVLGIVVPLTILSALPRLSPVDGRAGAA